jgi:hypothetical protein
MYHLFEVLGRLLDVDRPLGHIVLIVVFTKVQRLRCPPAIKGVRCQD